MDIDLSELASLVTLLKEADFTEFSYDKGDTHIVVRRSSEPGNEEPQSKGAADSIPAKAATPSIPIQPTMQHEPIEGAQVITAPMLGTFYASPKPGEPEFVSVGDRVGPDSVVCIVEVMKLMNSVHAGISGTIIAIHAKNGELVEYGQPLFSIRETDAA